MKNDRQAMKILGLLENQDKKEVILYNFLLIFFDCFFLPHFTQSKVCTTNLDSSCECPIIFSDRNP